ncbi:MAG: hypothetical protein ACFBSD_08995 [Paracoccaceae bacterium]
MQSHVPAAYWLLILVVLAACGAPPRAAAPASDVVTRASTVGAIGRLALGAQIALVRTVEGHPTAIPAAERVLWAGALREVNALLPVKLSFRPLQVPMRPTDDQGNSVSADPVEHARTFGFDALLIYDLAVRAEDDRAAAIAASLPIFGGIVPGTVTTEAHGSAFAHLIDLRTGASISEASARMVDRPVATLTRSEGRGEAVMDLALFAMLETVLPGVENMLVMAVADGV